MIDFASRHDPLPAKRLNAAPGQKDAFLVVDDAGDDRGFDRLFFEFHFGSGSRAKGTGFSLSP